jgi:hypothetical protein
VYGPSSSRGMSCSTRAVGGKKDHDGPQEVALTATMAGALGLSLGLGAGTASADPGHGHGCPPGLQGPGPGCLPPPGQIGQDIGVPPGHWNDIPREFVPGWVLMRCPDLNPGCINHL